jgi:hypothetical protein
MATWQEATGERPRSGAGQTFLAYATYKTRWERASASIPLLPGSRDNPFLLAQWPKPAWDAYPTLYFAGLATKVSQKSLEARFKAGDPTVVPYYPRGGVLGPNKIGIQLPYRIKAGKDPIGPITNKTSPGGDKLARLLKPYGYDSVNDGLECDHIQDVQVGGIDAVQNLWPLARSINGPAGGRLHGSKLLFPDRKSDVPLKDLKLATTMQFFFRIEKTL